MPLQRHSDSPALHIQVAQILKNRIHDGVWASGAPIPTEKELCAEFDVARGTVRQALQTLEMDGYLRREQGRGTFVTFGQAAAQPPKTQRNRLAFVVPYVRDSSVSTIFMGFQHFAEEKNYTILFKHVNNDVRQQSLMIEKLYEEGAAGIALYPVDSEVVEPIRRYIRAGFPIVLVDRYLKTLSTDFVMTDHFGGSVRGVQYMLDQGHERIGFATWLSPAVSMEQRYLGYQQALRERGISSDESLVCHVEGYPTIDLTPLRSFLSHPNRPTAVFAANDQIAIALYRAAASIGLRVPDDLSVIGFDNLDLSEQLDPPLTTVAQEFTQIGQVAADILLQRIGGDQSYFHQVTISPRMIIRASTLPYQPASELKAQQLLT
jgi:GntR family transcriptional regulator, arabinose operon transcriptional repressor